jgi:hypothetical protein
MTYLDRLLALRKDQGEERQEPEIPFNEKKLPRPRFPERHCSKCGEVKDENDLFKSDGYLWHRACLQERDREQRQSVTCWHCNKLVYRPRYLAWGKDLIPLHDGCVGAWIDAWDALLAEKSGCQQ